MNSHTRGVLLDVDGTLYLQPPLRILLSFLLAAGLLIHPVRTLRDIYILSVFRRNQETLRNKPLDAHEGADPQEVMTSVQTGYSLRRIREAVDRWMYRKALSLIPWVARRSLIYYVKNLHAAGVPIGIYSDYRAQEKLKSLGLAFLSDKAVCSTDPDVRAFKPDPRGFLEALRRIGTAPEETIFLGDRKDTDGQGASKAGMEVLILRPWRTPRVVLHRLDRILAEKLRRAESSGNGIRP